MTDYLYWEDYSLPSLSVSKTRSQPNPRRETSTFDGPVRVELKSNPQRVPATYTCSLICANQIETSIVGSFFELINKSYSMLFYKDLPTEYGLKKHLVRIIGGLPQPDPNATMRNDMMSYSFTAYVEQVERPESIINNPMLYLRWGRSAGILDVVVNVTLPEV